MVSGAELRPQKHFRYILSRVFHRCDMMCFDNSLYPPPHQPQSGPYSPSSRFGESCKLPSRARSRVRVERVCIMSPRNVPADNNVDKFCWNLCGVNWSDLTLNLCLSYFLFGFWRFPLPGRLGVEVGACPLPLEDRNRYIKRKRDCSLL